MKTILMITPNATDGVSLYRHWGPMLALEKQGHVRLVSMPDDPKQISNWQYYKKCDLAFFHRPVRISDEAVFKECEKHGLPTWVDIDDNVWSISGSNDAFDFYNPMALTILGKILQRATVTTVATRPLQSFLRGKLGVEARLVKNALDDNLLRYKKPFKPSQTILWRGSKSGQEAFAYYRESLRGLEPRLIVLGIDPFFIVPEIKWVKSQNFIDYINTLSKINSPFSFMTHLATEFDETKSCNGWLEVTLTGGVCLMPQYDDWDGCPGFHYLPGNTESFKYRLDQMLKSSDQKLKELHEISFALIKENHLLSSVNLERLKIIEEIV